MMRITVSSFKGGTAKTSTALHLGAALAMHYQQKVLLVDFDAQANLTAGFGLDPDEQDSLAVVLQDKKSIDEVIVPTGIQNLDLIPADTWLERVELTTPLATDRYSHEKLGRLLKSVHYDIILIDTPPSLNWLTESALIAAEQVLICSVPEFYSVKGLGRLRDFIEGIAERHPLEVLGVVLSFWNSRGKNNDSFLRLIEGFFPGKIFSTKIRRDVAVSEASIQGVPVLQSAPASRAAKDFYAFTEEVHERLLAGVL